MNDHTMLELRVPTLAKIALFATLCAACTQNVDPVGGGTGGDGGAGSGTTASTGATNAGGASQGGSSQGGETGEGGSQLVSANAIAMLQSELPDVGSGGGSSSVATGPEPDPNTLHVDISDIPIECAMPYGLDCGGHWKVSFALPVELQHPGIYPLEQINGFFMVAGDEDPVDCSGGGGSWWDGTVEITEINDQHVVGTFSNTSTFDFDINGTTFDAARCF